MKILNRWDEFIQTIKAGIEKRVLIEYIVQSGDYLGKIANKFSITVSDILAVNPQLKDPSMLNIGEILTIPVKDDLFKDVPEWARAAVMKAYMRGLIFPRFSGVKRLSKLHQSWWLAGSKGWRAFSLSANINRKGLRF